LTLAKASGMKHETLFSQDCSVAVLLTAASRIVGVNATGRFGRIQIDYMRERGTPLVALTQPGKGGAELGGLPVFDTVEEAVAVTGADSAIVYTPPGGVADSVIECAEAGLGFAVVAAEFVAVHDTMHAVAQARARGMWVVGPNTTGMATPGVGPMGGIPPEFCLPGRVGVIGRSGTLTINVTRLLTNAGIGQSTVVHIGGDMLCGRNPHEWLDIFAGDPGTDAIVYLGEIGGGKEYALAERIAVCGKPVVVLIVGRNAPAGKRMGHAGALVEGNRGTAAAKIDALRAAGAHVALSPAAVVARLEEIMT